MQVCISNTSSAVCKSSETPPPVSAGPVSDAATPEPIVPTHVAHRCMKPQDVQSEDEGLNREMKMMLS